MILRRKLFTRGQQQAFRQLYRLSRGLPKTSNPRDVLRLKKVSNDFQRFSRGDVKEIDIKNAKTLLTNAGYTKAAEELEGMVSKYTNKRALVRLKNIKNKKSEAERAVERQKDAKEFNKFYKRRDKFIKTNKDSIETLDNLKKTSQSDPEINSKLVEDLKRRDSGIKVSTDKSFSPEFSRGNSDYLADDKAGFVVRRYKKGSGEIRLNNDLDKANTNTVAHEYGHARSDLQSTSKKSGILDFDGINREISPNNREGQKKASLHIKVGKRSEADYGKAKILSKTSMLRKTADGFANVAEERIANSYGQARLNKLGKKDNFSQHSKAIEDSYLSNEVVRGLDSFVKKPKRK